MSEIVPITAEEIRNEEDTWTKRYKARLWNDWLKKERAKDRRISKNIANQIYNEKYQNRRKKENEKVSNE